jgi:hypothetical protein
MRQWRYISTILDLGVRWRLSGQLLTPVALPPGKSIRYPLYRRFGGPRAGLDDMKKRKISLPFRESNFGRLVSSPSLYNRK